MHGEQALVAVLLVTLKVATVSTLVGLVIGVPLAYVLSRARFRGRELLLGLTALPLVVPPTAIGFLLLELLADRGPLGRETLGFDLGLLFSWKAAVLASTVMALPLVVRTAKVAFDGVDPKLEAMARTLGHTPLSVFVRFVLPLARRGIVAAGLLGFVRSLGEFGATITLAGNIAGKTQTLATGIYAAQQSGSRAQAAMLVGIAFAAGLVATVFAERLTGAREESRS
jgi:molybdate transport system permease protein